MDLKITQKLAITQAVLTLFVITSATVAIYVSTAKSLVSESRKSAESEAYQAAQQLSAQLNEDVLVEFGGDPLPFRNVQVPTTHWAVVRGSDEFVLSRGVFAAEEERFLELAPETGIVELADGRVFRTVSLPFPKHRTESFGELSEPVRKAIREERPGALYLRARHEAVSGKSVREIELLEGHDLLEYKVTPDGEILEGEVLRLPRSLPQKYVESFFGVQEPREAVPISWTGYDFQLLMMITLPEAGGTTRQLLVNRYLERFVLGEDGALSGPTEETALRLLVATDTTNVERTMGVLLGRLLIGGPIVWLLMVGIGWLVMRRAFFPVRRMLDAANSIEPAHLDARLPTGKVRDELHSIAETINRMLDRLEEGFHRERRFTGDASHELRGPLAKIIAEIDVALSKDRQPGDYREALERCRRYAGGLKGIVQALLLLTRLDQPDRKVDTKSIDIQSVVVDTANSLPEEEGRRVTLDLWRGKAPLFVRGRGELLGILIRNLLENALRYSPPEEPVEVRVRSRGDSVLLEIEDHGPGIPDETRERVFDRFFRLDESRAKGTGGAGLGLSIVRSIARAHGGNVALSFSNSGGTVACVSLPAAADGTSSDPSPPIARRVTTT